jgi:hypothetical protein
LSLASLFCPHILKQGHPREPIQPPWWRVPDQVRGQPALVGRTECKKVQMTQLLELNYSILSNVSFNVSIFLCRYLKSISISSNKPFCEREYWQKKLLSLTGLWNWIINGNVFHQQCLGYLMVMWLLKKVRLVQILHPLLRKMLFILRLEKVLRVRELVLELLSVDKSAMKLKLMHILCMDY